jgi:AcrR family transcriptional regulator
MASRQRQEEVRERLLEAIEAVTQGGEGLGEVSVERLANAAGISRATFYIYFADKGDLLTARFEQVAAELLEAAGGWWEIGAESSIDDLRGALARIAGAYRPHATLIAAIYDEAAYNPGVRRKVAGFVQAGMDALREHIERGQRDQFVDPALLAPETAAWLGWMVERGLLDVVGPALEDEVEALVSAQADLVWHTLYVR